MLNRSNLSRLIHRLRSISDYDGPGVRVDPARSKDEAERDVHARRVAVAVPVVGTVKIGDEMVLNTHVVISVADPAEEHGVDSPLGRILLSDDAFKKGIKVSDLICTPAAAKIVRKVCGR